MSDDLRTRIVAAVILAGWGDDFERYNPTSQAAARSTAERIADAVMAEIAKESTPSERA